MHHSLLKRRSRGKRFLTAAAATASLLILVYLVFCYSSFSCIRVLRHAAIETSLSTMRHRWVAYAIFPDRVVNNIQQTVLDARQAQIGLTSTWPHKPEKRQTDINNTEDILQLFPQIDAASLQACLNSDRSWSAEDPGSFVQKDLDSVYTVHGHKVLVIDVPNRLMLVEIKTAMYKGVLAICADPARLSVRPALSIGVEGERIGQIAQRNNGILAMTASGFRDIDLNGNPGRGNGGIVAGLTRCSNVTYSSDKKDDFKRIELRKDDLLYITDSAQPIHPDCTDAVEFYPALIVDSRITTANAPGSLAINPRACIGQAANGDILMLCVEGRRLTSLGITADGCAKLLRQYNCCQALNLDGGTSAMLWYDGECMIRCSNDDYPEGRPLPNAFVYEKCSEP